MSEALMKGNPTLQHKMSRKGLICYPIKQASGRPVAHLQLLCWIMNMTMSSCEKPSGTPLGFSCVNMLVRSSSGRATNHASTSVFSV